jgi:hypothetical protein
LMPALTEREPFFQSQTTPEMPANCEQPFVGHAHAHMQLPSMNSISAFGSPLARQGIPGGPDPVSQPNRPQVYGPSLHSPHGKEPVMGHDMALLGASDFNPHPPDFCGPMNNKDGDKAKKSERARGPSDSQLHISNCALNPTMEQAQGPLCSVGEAIEAEHAALSSLLDSVIWRLHSSQQQAIALTLQCQALERELHDRDHAWATNCRQLQEENSALAQKLGLPWGHTECPNEAAGATALPFCGNKPAPEIQFTQTEKETAQLLHPAFSGDVAKSMPASYSQNLPCEKGAAHAQKQLQVEAAEARLQNQLGIEAISLSGPEPPSFEHSLHALLMYAGPADLQLLRGNDCYTPEYPRQDQGPAGHLHTFPSQNPPDSLAHCPEVASERELAAAQLLTAHAQAAELADQVEQLLELNRDLNSALEQAEGTISLLQIDLADRATFLHCSEGEEAQGEPPQPLEGCMPSQGGSFTRMVDTIGDGSSGSQHLEGLQDGSFSQALDMREESLAGRSAKATRGGLQQSKCAVLPPQASPQAQAQVWRHVGLEVKALADSFQQSEDAITLLNQHLVEKDELCSNLQSKQEVMLARLLEAESMAATMREQLEQKDATCARILAAQEAVAERLRQTESANTLISTQLDEKHLQCLSLEAERKLAFQHLQEAELAAASLRAKLEERDQYVQTSVAHPLEAAQRLQHSESPASILNTQELEDELRKLASVDKSKEIEGFPHTTDLPLELWEKEESCSSVRADQGAIAQELRQTRAAMGDLTSQLQQQEELCECLLEEQEKILESFQQSKQAVAVLQTQLEQKEELCQSMRAEQEELSSRLQQAEADMHVMRSSIVDMDQLLCCSHAERDALTERCSSLEEDLRATEAQLVSLLPGGHSALIESHFGDPLRSASVDASQTVMNTRSCPEEAVSGSDSQQDAQGKTSVGPVEELRTLTAEMMVVKEERHALRQQVEELTCQCRDLSDDLMAAEAQICRLTAPSDVGLPSRERSTAEDDVLLAECWDPPLLAFPKTSLSLRKKPENTPMAAASASPPQQEIHQLYPGSPSGASSASRLANPWPVCHLDSNPFFDEERASGSCNHAHVPLANACTAESQPVATAPEGNRTTDDALSSSGEAAHTQMESWRDQQTLQVGVAGPSALDHSPRESHPLHLNWMNFKRHIEILKGYVQQQKNMCQNSVSQSGGTEELDCAAGDVEHGDARGSLTQRPSDAAPDSVHSSDHNLVVEPADTNRVSPTGPSLCEPALEQHVGPCAEDPAGDGAGCQFEEDARMKLTPMGVHARDLADALVECVRPGDPSALCAGESTVGPLQATLRDTQGNVSSSE